MLTVLEQKNEIALAQRLFVQKMKKATDRTEKIWVGYQGGNHYDMASWSRQLGIWWVHSAADGNRYWNAFGTGEPEWGTRFSHSIICEINLPLEGINRRIAGVFARDGEGKLFVLHRGKIGGGKPGNSKSKFVNEFTGDWITADDGAVTSKFALVAPFEDPQFTGRVGKFVAEIERIKKCNCTPASTL